MEQIHEHDIEELYNSKRNIIEENKSKFENMSHGGKKMNEIIDLEKQREENLMRNECDSEDEYEETTTADELKDFQKDFDKWKKEGQKNIKYLKQFTDVICPEDLKTLINGLNGQQRKIFDDILERETCSLTEKEPYHVFIAGEAGTGKSHLTKVLMEAFKSINLHSGKEINKPRILAIAPTANAAYIIGGKTIDSALAMDGSNYVYRKLPAERESDLQYIYMKMYLLYS